MRAITRFVASALALALTAAPAGADEVDAAVAAARGAGLPTASDLEETANASAAAQAAAGSLFHASIGSLTSLCAAAAEIVGRGPSVSAIFSAFRTSSLHWKELSDPGWTSMGTGLVAGGDGNLYVSVVFCRQSGASAPGTRSTRPSGSGTAPARSPVAAPPPPPPPPPPLPIPVDVAPASFLPVETWHLPNGPSVS